MGVLTIYLDRCENIADTDIISDGDPYVTLMLEKDNMIGDVDYGSQRTTTQKGNSPTFGESFTFHVPSLDNLVLSVKIQDEDTGRDDRLGSCKIKLEGKGLSESPTEFSEVVDRNIIHSNGMIYLTLAWSE